MQTNEILVPRAWLEHLLAYEERVKKQIDGLEDPSVLYKTDISALLGYASSAKTILKYNEEVHNDF